MRFLLTASFLILFVFKVTAQQDTVKHPFYFSLADEIYNEATKSVIDTDFTDFQISNPVYKNFPMLQYCGNLGSALNYGFRQDDNLLRNYGFNQFDIYKLTDRPEGFRNERTVNTKILYTRGVKKEQKFYAGHYQHITQNLSAGLDFNSIISPGLYKNQKTFARIFDLYLLFETKNHAYTFFADFITDKITNEENGGLVDDSVLQYASREEWVIVPVNLNDGASSMKTKEYIVKQQLNFKTEKTVNKNDSSLMIKPVLFLHYDFAYKKNSYVFTNSSYDSAYFAHTYLDTISTNDSSYFDEYINKAYLGFEKEKFTLHAGVEHQQYRYRVVDESETNQLLNVTGDLNFKISNNLFWTNSLAVNAFGSAGTYFYKSNLAFTLKNKSSISAELFLRNEAPTLKSENYYSNHFIWKADFNNSLTNSINVFYQQKLFRIGAKFSVLKNTIYYNQFSLPLQYEGITNVSEAFINLNLKAGNWHFNGKYTLQKCDNETVIQLPLFNSLTSVFYADNAFKRALYFQVGADCFYNTAYNASSYMPATGSFYYQSETKTGNFAYVDVYVSGRIKTVKLTLKCENIGGRFWGDNFFMTAHYPLPGRALKFSFEWRFYN